MSRVEELENEIKELDNRRIKLQQELKIEKQKNEIEYPLKHGEKYWYVASAGVPHNDTWTNQFIDRAYYTQGNVFLTEKEAQREIERRNLLTRFRQFRDSCNGDWKPDLYKVKYYICLKCETLRLSVTSSIYWNSFNMFGYFENKQDAERAIEFFGDEIKRLFVEE